VSTDGGENWTPFIEGIYDGAVQPLAINPASPDVLYTGTTGDGDRPFILWR
jgi:hypothetical protein